MSCAHSSTMSALLLMPISGGPPRRLVDCARASAFAPVARTVFYVACDPGLDPLLHTIELDTGRDRTLGRLQHFPPDQLGIGLAVSPDGKPVLYRGLVRLGGDLMLIENFR